MKMSKDNERKRDRTCKKRCNKNSFTYNKTWEKRISSKFQCDFFEDAIEPGRFRFFCYEALLLIFFFCWVEPPDRPVTWRMWSKTFDKGDFNITRQGCDKTILELIIVTTTYGDTRFMFIKFHSSNGVIFSLYGQVLTFHGGAKRSAARRLKLSLVQNFKLSHMPRTTVANLGEHHSRREPLLSFIAIHLRPVQIAQACQKSRSFKVYSLVQPCRCWSNASLMLFGAKMKLLEPCEPYGL